MADSTDLADAAAQQYADEFAKPFKAGELYPHVRTTAVIAFEAGQQRERDRMATLLAAHHRALREHRNIGGFSFCPVCREGARAALVEDEGRDG